MLSVSTKVLMCALALTTSAAYAFEDEVNAISNELATDIKIAGKQYASVHSLVKVIHYSVGYLNHGTFCRALVPIALHSRQRLVEADAECLIYQVCIDCNIGNHHINVVFIEVEPYQEFIFCCRFDGRLGMSDG